MRNKIEIFCFRFSFYYFFLYWNLNENSWHKATNSVSFDWHWISTNQLINGPLTSYPHFLSVFLPFRRIDAASSWSQTIITIKNPMHSFAQDSDILTNLFSIPCNCGQKTSQFSVINSYIVHEIERSTINLTTTEFETYDRFVEQSLEDCFM